MDHDRLFKELLVTFFAEFIELFLPDLAQYVERGRFEFLDKEIFTDVASGERHEVDLLVKARFRDRGEAFFLVHVENQSQSDADFPRRMFAYFSRLHEKHQLPIYPIALFSYERPLRAEPDEYAVEFPGFRVLDFRFRVIQLNRLSWRDYVRNPNPVASALMTRMQIAAEDRPRVKLECLRMLATLKLDRARSTLISAFMDRYLKLTAAETVVYNKQVQAIEPAEREVVMQWTNEWIEAGKAEGLHEGRERMVLRLLRRRLGELPAEWVDQIKSMDEAEMDDLADALLDFHQPADAQAWFSARRVR